MMRAMMGKTGAWTVNITHEYDMYSGTIYIALNGVDIGSLSGSQEGSVLSLTYQKGDIIKFYSTTWRICASIYIDGVCIGSTNEGYNNTFEFVATKKHTIHLYINNND